MPLFQTSVLKKYLAELDAAKVQTAFAVFQSHFADPVKQENIRNAKEEQYQEGFLRELFVDALGYTLNPSPDYNLTTEFKNQTDAKKADGAIMASETALGVIELKSANTTDFKKIEEQAFRYKNNQKGCRYVVTSNFERLRFYIDDATDYEEWDLFRLTPERFALLYLCLAKTHLLAHIPLTIKENSVAQEENVTKKLYADYRDFKRNLFADLRARNPETDPLLLYKKTQKLLDRLLFIFFAEDRGLLPPNSIHEVLMQWQELRDKYDEPVSLYGRFRKYFGYMNTGHQGQKHEIFGYNGGLFAPDDTLDNLKVGDTALFNGAMALTRYDFVSEVDVNILGHIFEHSLNEIEEVQAELEGRAVDKGKTKRKKDGVFYTPKYITQYIVENTVGTLCRQKQAELGLRDEDYAEFRKDKAQRKQLHARLDAYRQWLLGITILDPACGSGAFLNQAFNFLIDEHARLDRLQANLFGDALALSDVDLAILEHNLYGVDLNEESVEIAQLALWLRTAKKGRKLSALSHNLRRGNSLIDDPAVAGDAAFDWQQAFPEVFAKGGFDVVVGNPPYVRPRFISDLELAYLRDKYQSAENQIDLYQLFIEKGKFLLKNRGFFSFIVPNAFLANESSQKLRQEILNNFTIDSICDSREQVFAEADVDSLIFIFSKGIVKSEGRYLELKSKDFVFKNTFKSKDFWETKNNNFIVTLDKNSKNLFEKIQRTSKAVEDFFDVITGIKEYQIGKGNPPQTQEDKDTLRFNAGFKKDETFQPELRGKNITRYGINWENEHISYGPWIAEPRSAHFFEGEKILVRQIPGKNTLVTGFTSDYFVVDQTVFIAKRKIGVDINTKYVLCLLNSRLLYWYFKNENNEFDELFPKIKAKELKSLLIFEADNNTQKLFAGKADNIQSDTNDLLKIQARFLSLLTAKYPSLQPTKKLESWPELTFAEFLKEVKKQKIAWSLREESEWLEHFTAEQAAARALRQEIEKADREIDRMVYELYGLTEEEIALVEGKG